MSGISEKGAGLIYGFTKAVVNDVSYPLVDTRAKELDAILERSLAALESYIADLERRAGVGNE